MYEAAEILSSCSSSGSSLFTISSTDDFPNEVNIQFSSHIQEQKKKTQKILGKSKKSGGGDSAAKYEVRSVDSLPSISTLQSAKSLRLAKPISPLVMVQPAAKGDDDDAGGCDDDEDDKGDQPAERGKKVTIDEIKKQVIANGFSLDNQRIPVVREEVKVVPPFPALDSSVRREDRESRICTPKRKNDAANKKKSFWKRLCCCYCWCCPKGRANQIEQK